MKYTIELKAARKFNLGYFVKEQLEAQKITESDLAKRLDLSIEELVNRMDGNEMISDNFALRLSRVLGYSDHYWCNLKASFMDWSR